MAKSYEELVEELDSPDAGLAAQAARELGALGDRRAVTPLLRALRRTAADPWNPGNRARAGAAAAALGDLGLGWLGETQALIAQGPGQPVRDRVQQAVRDWSLGLLGSVPAPARRRIIEEWVRHSEGGVAAMMEWVATRTGPERLWFAEALGRLGGPVVAEGLVAMLVREDGSFDLAASVGLGHMGYTRVAPALTAALDSDEPMEVQAAAGALGALGAAAGAALPRLYALASDAPDSATWGAARAAARLIEEELRWAPAELEASSAPAGRGTELEAAPEGRATELEAAPGPEDEEEA